MIIVRFADDAVLGFQNREDAVRFLAQLGERLRKFGLELHPDKTRLMEFGRYAAERRKKRGEGKPEIFNFLGFTHICGRSCQTGYFTVFRRTIGKRMAAKLKDLGQQLRQRMHEGTADTARWLAAVRGYFQYHAEPENEERLKAFRNDVLRLWRRQLNRRSQRSPWTWTRFQERLGCLLPKVELVHPWPLSGSPLKPKVGTVCVSSASTALCGGQRATAVPTAARIETHLDTLAPRVHSVENEASPKVATRHARVRAPRYPPRTLVRNAG